MKVLLRSFVVVAIAHCPTNLADAAQPYSYNGYANRELAKEDRSNLFGLRLVNKNDQGQANPSKSDTNPPDTGNKNLRRHLEGEVPVPPDMDSADGAFFDNDDAAITDDDDNIVGEDEGAITNTADDDIAGEERDQQSFFESESIAFFKKGIDPDLFEWVNDEEIIPGAWTCGFLKPNLGTTPGEVFPQIEVYVCMRFANEQPAKKGNIFTHCGGPSSLSSCTIMFQLGDEAFNDYNFLTIDQRGLGRSWPSMGHEECMVQELVRDDNGIIVNSTYPEDSFLPDYTDVESIKASLEPQKRRAQDCWTCENCDFKLTAPQDDGTNNTYHFLEYSGSRQLAEDIERMRMLLNAPVMHIYGVSYGTQVFGTYATLFPSRVGLMVLDGNVNPYQNLEEIAHDQAVGENTRISYALFSCSASNAEEPGSCPVDDLPKCVSDLGTFFRDQWEVEAVYTTSTIAVVLSLLGKFPDRAEEICDLANSQDGEELDELLGELLDVAAEMDSAVATKQGPTFEYNSESGPTVCVKDIRCDVFGNEEFETLFSEGTETWLVNVQDAFSALYDADYFARRVKEFGEFYTGAGTGAPVQKFYIEWSAGFNWPKGVPLAPMGNPLLSGIVAGQLYDYATPYVWTMDMRQNFPFTSLLTSQSTQHGLDGNAPSCQNHVKSYFDLGYIEFVDGTVCGADFADQSLISDTFNGAGF